MKKNISYVSILEEVEEYIKKAIPNCETKLVGQVISELSEYMNKDKELTSDMIEKILVYHWVLVKEKNQSKS